MPITIHNYLKKTIYEDCFYQWFGYPINTFHLIYNYNKYQMMVFGYSKIISILHTLLDDSPVTNQNCKIIHTFCKKQTNYGLFELFFKHSVDITGGICNNHLLCEPLIEHIL